MTSVMLMSDILFRIYWHSLMEARCKMPIHILPYTFCRLHSSLTTCL